MVDGGTHFIQDLGSRNKTYRGNVSSCRPQVMGSLSEMGPCGVQSLSLIQSWPLPRLSSPDFVSQLWREIRNPGMWNYATRNFGRSVWWSRSHSVSTQGITSSNHGYSTCSLVSLKSINYLLCIGKLVVMAISSLLPVVLVQGVLQWVMSFLYTETHRHGDIVTTTECSSYAYIQHTRIIYTFYVWQISHSEGDMITNTRSHTASRYGSALWECWHSQHTYT